MLPTFTAREVAITLQAFPRLAVPGRPLCEAVARQLQAGGFRTPLIDEDRAIVASAFVRVGLQSGCLSGAAVRFRRMSYAKPDLYRYRGEVEGGLFPHQGACSFFFLQISLLFFLFNRSIGLESP